MEIHKSYFPADRDMGNLSNVKAKWTKCCKRSLRDGRESLTNCFDTKGIERIMASDCSRALMVMLSSPTSDGDSFLGLRFLREKDVMFSIALKDTYFRFPFIETCCHISKSPWVAEFISSRHSVLGFPQLPRSLPEYSLWCQSRPTERDTSAAIPR